MQKSLAQVTLDEIFHYETRVYINPSAKKSGYSRDYNGLGNHLIEGQYIDFLDPNKLLYTYKEELNHNKLLRFNNASTIYPATTEIRRFNRILRHISQKMEIHIHIEVMRSEEHTSE